MSGLRLNIAHALDQQIVTGTANKIAGKIIKSFRILHSLKPFHDDSIVAPMNNTIKGWMSTVVLVYFYCLPVYRSNE